jgi:hypothetical protein
MSPRAVARTRYFRRFHLQMAISADFGARAPLYRAPV